MKKSTILIICIIWLSGCGDFLQEQSQQYVYASSCSDLDELLIGSVYMPGESGYYYPPTRGNGINYPWLHLLDDDCVEYVRNWEYPHYSPIKAFRSFHAWNENPFLDEETGEIAEDRTWLWLYKAANYANVILSQVDEFPNDPEEIRRRVSGEAQFLRGAYYYLLNNIYAKAYVKETAQSDLGVPLKITEYVEDKYYERASNATVYSQIIKDLRQAADNLAGIQQKTIYRVNEAAARTLLSRVYLYTGEWQACIDECDKVIQSGCKLWDLNSFKLTDNENTRDFILSTESPEIFFTQGGPTMSLFMPTSSEAEAPYCVSEDLINLYYKYEDKGFTDIRSQAYFKALKGEHSGHYYVKKHHAYASSVTVFDSFTLRAAEIFLNKAEAEAILDKAEAKTTIKTLLEHRFKDNRIPNIDALAGEDLIKFIREERRRELCFECHRWFDLRRYAVNPKYPERTSIQHPIYANAVNPPELQATVELKPYGEDGAWVMPIPRFEIDFNKGKLLQNEKRPERHIK